MDRRVQKTKTAVQDAYFSLLMGNKTAHITIAEISRKANIDRKTFYLHYNSTEDILREFSRDTVREWMDQLKKDGFFEKPFDVHLLFRDLNDLIMQNLEFYKQLIYTSVFDFICTEMYDMLVKAMKAVYIDVIDIFPDEMDVYARFYVSGVLSLYVAWLKQEIPFDIDKLGEMAADMTCSGAEKAISAMECSDSKTKPY